MQRFAHLSILLLLCCGHCAQGDNVINPEHPESIQQAITAEPGRVHFLPPGDYLVSRKIQIGKDNTGLYGPGRIVQSNPNEPIVELQHASGVTLRHVTLTRARGSMEARAPGVVVDDCSNVTLDGVQVLDNHSQQASIRVSNCTSVRILHCVVRNYSRIGVDDRTASQDWGYAFHCLDGTGIGVTSSTGVLIQGNHVVELNLRPTREIKQKHNLGNFVRKNPQRGRIVSQETWDDEYVNNWHQGSAILVTAPEVSDCIQILGNRVENAAQGIDIHADHVIVANNIVNNAHIGMKAMHGSRNVLIQGNQFSRNVLWSIGLMPGAASRAIGVPVRSDETPENVVANVDGGSIVAHNIISDFGYGDASWIWGEDGCPIRFDRGQLAGNPPLTDVVVQGNVVYDTGREGTLVDGETVNQPPRYRYAVLIETDGHAKGPVGLRFSSNIFHPGREGVSNVQLSASPE